MKLLAIFWLAAMVIFGIVEASCPCLLSIWFAAGSLVAFIAAILGAGLWVQIGLFVVVSGAMLAALRPMLRKYVIPHITPTNTDSLIGKEAIVVADIDNAAAQGRVKVNGMEWSARSSDGSAITAGSHVSILRIEGVKLIVEPANVPAAN